MCTLPLTLRIPGPRLLSFFLPTPPESPSPTTSLLLPGSNFILGYTVTMTIDASPIQDTLK